MEDKIFTNNFHLIRFLAAVFVIISHSYALIGLPEHDSMWKFTNYNFSFSYIGLSTFFILSGYLITQSANPEKMMNFKTAIMFLWRRALRIFPALFVVILFSVFVLGPVLTNLPIKEYFLSSITWDYLQGVSLYLVKFNLPGVFSGNPYPDAFNGSLWTLAYEFTLYLVILFLAFFGLKKIRIFVLGIFIYFLYQFSTATPGSSYILPIVYIDIFRLLPFAVYFLGGAVLLLFKDLILMKFWIFVVCFVLLMLGWYKGFPLITTGFFLPYIIIYLAQIKGRMNNFARLGDFSYGMYLFAFPIQQTIVYLFGKMPVEIMILISILITLPVAFLSWHLVEKRALKLKNKFFLTVN